MECTAFTLRKLVCCIDSSTFFIILRERGAKNQTEGSPYRDTHRYIIEDNTKQGADASPNGKPQTDLVGGFLWLCVFLFIGHVYFLHISLHTSCFRQKHADAVALI
jgi:hypothetical protein